MSHKFKAPNQAIGAPKQPLKHEDYSWFFSSDVRKWCPGPKLSPVRYAHKGIRAIKTGGKKFGGRLTTE